jgi:hypothetical protein
MVKRVRILTPEKALEKFLPVESVRLDAARSVALLSVRVPVTAPHIPDPEDPVEPPVVTPPAGTPIDALMPIYLTPRAGDPYSPPVIDRPPSLNGVPVGYLAAPSLYGYPDETNTGLAVNNIAIASLPLAPAGTLQFTRSGLNLGGVFYPRPTSGSSTPTPGVTMYPLAGNVMSGQHFAPVHQVIDHLHTQGPIYQWGDTNTLIKDCLVDGVSSAYGAVRNRTSGNSASQGNATGDGVNAGYMIVTNSRLHGGPNAEATVQGNRWYVNHCNITGGCDIHEPGSSCYSIFNYGHGLKLVGAYHNDFAQVIQSTNDPLIAPRFGGWSTIVHRCTGLSYGEKNGAQWLMLGEQQRDSDRVLVSQNLGYGGVTQVHGGLGKYANGYGTDSTGAPITQYSSITGLMETHPWTRALVIRDNRFGRRSSDNPYPGGGYSRLQKIPEQVTSPSFDDYKFIGKYGEAPPYTAFNNVWDDSGVLAIPNIGHGTAEATANGFDDLTQLASRFSLSYVPVPNLS